jgi:transposase
MLGDISGLEKIYIVCGYTDMRKSIDGLCAIIEDQLKVDPTSSALFLFCGRRRDRIKALFHEPLSADFCYPHNCPVYVEKLVSF